MTILGLFEQINQRLAQIYSEGELHSISNWLVEDLTGLERHKIPLQLDQLVNQDEIDQLDIWISRLEKHEPIQYVLGYAPFLGMNLKVNEHVLIPRPETEELVMMVVEAARKLELSSTKIVDVGTGSGCIPIGIKNHLPNAAVIATELSDSALGVARVNAQEQGLEVRFINQDFLNTAPDYFPDFEILVSNPPYVLESDKNEMQPNVVEYEPWMALFPEGNDDLIFYRRLFEIFEAKGSPGNLMFLEIHESKGEELTQLASRFNWTEFEIREDLQGKDRFFVARR